MLASKLLSPLKKFNLLEPKPSFAKLSGLICKAFSDYTVSNSVDKGTAGTVGHLKGIPFLFDGL